VIESGGARPGDAVLITGCSTGLGMETALYLAERGLTVYASMRDLDRQAALLEAAERRRVSLEVLRLDVTDPASIEAAIATAAVDGLYGLVNNAGIGLRGCLEDLALDEIRRVFEVNVLGAMAVTQRVLPHLRTAGRGRVVTISSVAGKIASFGLSAYCASKFALEGFGEALALEIAPFGLKSILIEPGIVKTSRWTINRGTARDALTPASPYHRLFNRHEQIADDIVERSKTRPADVAEAVHRALTVDRPRLRYLVGRPASAAVNFRRYAPAALFERLYFGSLLRRLAHEGRLQ